MAQQQQQQPLGMGVGMGMVAQGVAAKGDGREPAFRPMEMCLVYAERCATGPCDLGRGGNADCVLAAALPELQRGLPIYERASPAGTCVLLGDRLYGVNDGNRHLCDPDAMRARAEAERARDDYLPAVVPCDTGHIAVAAALADGSGDFAIRCVPQPLVRVEITRAAPPGHRAQDFKA
jgi:hypothetical protein